MAKKVLLAAAIMIYPIIGLLWISAGVIDLVRVHRFERPIFCVLQAGSAFDDGGSGTYVGFGYSFEIEGNFMPEDELPGVTRYTARIFNTPVMTGARA